MESEVIAVSALALRGIAVFLMFVDHIGFFTGNAAMRIVGRLSLPVFAFLIANGFKYTRNAYKYAIRLLVFAVLSEFAFDYCFFGEVAFVKFVGAIPRPSLDNIFFTLFIGLCFLAANRYFKSKFKHYLVFSLPTLLVMSYAAAFIGADYGAFGVLWVALFGLFDAEKTENRIPLAIGAALLSIWRFFTKALSASLGISFGGIPFVSVFLPSGEIGFMDTIQCLAVLSIVLIFLYNGKSGSPKSPVLKKVMQYSFYVFYPLHIIVLYCIFK